MFCFSRTNHTSMNLSRKLNKFTLLIYPFPRHLKLGKSLQNMPRNFFFCSSRHFKREKSVFWKASFLQNKNWLREQDFEYNISRLGQRVLHFFSRKLIYKSNRKLFSYICIAWYKHSRAWENSQQLCKPSTLSRDCITVENSPNPSSVYIRLRKHAKHFLLLKHSAPLAQTLYTNIFFTNNL